ncbi:hypothetical protein HPP92_011085 [Vanilla planifolia]|uniref:CCHC-type domain-containing protein n=1 Tax=Vanilla planifolia TaxID=51239 RepID=A0A835R5C9_VANPL|nr:hypothetical protein HPP92_011085 [Vanilla planifolia]
MEKICENTSAQKEMSRNLKSSRMGYNYCSKFSEDLNYIYSCPPVYDWRTYAFKPYKKKRSPRYKISKRKWKPKFRKEQRFRKKKFIKKYNKKKGKKHCRCFKCNKEGHYANECPVNIKRVIIPNIEEYSINIGTIDEISDDNSVYEITSYYDSTESESEQPSDKQLKGFDKLKINMITINKTLTQIKVIPLLPSLKLPKKEKISSPGYTIYMGKMLRLKRYRTTEITLDLIILIPFGYYGILHNIPYHAKENIFITHGIIEPMTYQAPTILIKNTSLEDWDYLIRPNDAIGTLVIHKYEDFPIITSETAIDDSENSEKYREFRVNMNTLTSEEVNTTDLHDSVGEQFEITDEDLEKLKEAIPHGEKNEIYKAPSFKSRFLNKHTYIFERMQGNIELKGDDDLTSISLLNKSKIEKLKRKYPKMKYLHIGMIQLKITALFRSGIDTPIMIVCMDERIINKPLSSIIGGAKSNLANRLFGINIHPDFCISLDDQNVEKTCTLSISLKGIQLLPGSKILGIQWEHCMALNDTSTFRSITPNNFVKLFNVGIGKTIQPKVVDIRHLKLDNDIQLFVKTLKPKVQIPVEYFIASGNTISTVTKNPINRISSSISLPRHYEEGETSEPLEARPSFHIPVQDPVEGRTLRLLENKKSITPP